MTLKDSREDGVWGGGGGPVGVNRLADTMTSFSSVIATRDALSKQSITEISHFNFFRLFYICLRFIRIFFY